MLFRVPILLILLILLAYSAQALSPPDFVVTARGLYAKFKPIVDQGKLPLVYRDVGKIFRITGEVRSQAISLRGHQLTLAGDDDWGLVYCRIKDESSPEVLKYSAGQAITLQCSLAPWSIGPEMAGCVLVVADESPLQ